MRRSVASGLASGSGCFATTHRIPWNQWTYTVMANGGFDADSTRTTAPIDRLANRLFMPLGELLHPVHVLRHSEADDYFVHQHLAAPALAMSSAIPLPDPTSPRPHLQVALNESERLAVVHPGLWRNAPQPVQR